MITFHVNKGDIEATVPEKPAVVMIKAPNTLAFACYEGHDGETALQLLKRAKKDWSDRWPKFPIRFPVGNSEAEL